MGIERAVGIAALVAALAAPAQAASFGIVMSDRDGALRVFFPSGTATTAGISVQYPRARQTTACCLRFGGDQLESLPADPLAVDAATGEPMQQFRVRDPAPAFSVRPFVGIAAITAMHAPRQTGTTTLRVAGGDSARSCFSAEGFHVKAYRAGKQVADYYLGLGYDIQRPTCRTAAAKQTSIGN